jgi:anaerobic magnesium-protoporphyrin IX monomethyl ester cyclase
VLKVFLVNPPYVTPFIREGRCQSPQNLRQNSIPQMTLAYLAGVLARENHDLEVYDCIASGIDEAKLFEEMAGFDPELGFVNTTTPTINSDLRFAQALKGRFPRVTLAAFGAHVTVLHEEILRTSPFLDIVIRGEPELIAADIARRLKNGRITGPISGCTARMDGKIKTFPDRSVVGNLDELGFPAWQYLPLDQYIHPVFQKPYVTVNTGRGCRHRCIFCVAPKYYGRSVRHRSPESVVGELKRDISEFCIRHFWFYADDFTENSAFVKRLCRSIIDADLDIVWWSNTRVDKPDREMFSLMKKAGCFMLSIGGESGSPDILKRMKKGTRIEDIQRMVRLLRKAGIDSLVYFLVGLPGETKQTIQETVRFARKVNSDYVEFYPATPYPGTEFYEIAAKEGMISKLDWSDYQYNEFVVEIPGVDAQNIKGVIKAAYRKFYFRPRYAVVLLKKIIRPAEFLRLLKFGWGYFRKLLA